MSLSQSEALATTPRFRRLKRAAVVLLVASVVGLATYFTYQYRGEQVLERTLAELDRTDRDWRIERIEANRREIPDEKNAALIVLNVYGLEYNIGPPALMPRTGWPPVALDKVFEGLEPQHQLNETQRTLLRTELQKLIPALAEARKLADLPDGRYVIAYSRDGYSTLLPHLQGNRSVANLLIHDARLRAQDGQLDEALRSLRAGVNCGRALGDEPFLISQLVRIACVSVVTSELERMLAQGEPAPDALTQMQKLLEAEAEHNALLVGVYGDRAMSHRLMQAIADRAITPNQYQMLLGKRTGPVTGVAMLDEVIEAWRPGSLPGPRDHAALLEYHSRVIEIAKLPVEERAPRLKELEATLPHLSAAARVLVPASFKVAEADAKRVAGLRCAVTALAAERYRLATGHWPESLAALTPDYIVGIPLDPFDAKPLRLIRLPDGLTIYSVGIDRVDDGGKVVRNSGPRSGTDLGFRLWDPRFRRMLPLPPGGEPQPLADEEPAKP